MTMDELVQRLAELQAERKAEENTANSDKRICRFELEIRDIESTLAAVVRARDEVKSPYLERVAEIDAKIDRLKAQIVEAWDGEKKTLKYDAGTLKFRTSESLVIEKEALVLTGLLDHTSVKDVANNYITGFNKTAVKKFMGVLSLPMGAAWIDQKTTVKLEIDG